MLVIFKKHFSRHQVLFVHLAVLAQQNLLSRTGKFFGLVTKSQVALYCVVAVQSTIAVYVKSIHLMSMVSSLSISEF